MSSRFFENQPHEICNHLIEKASKGKFLGPYKLQNHTTIGKKGEKERARRKKGGEQKKAMVALLVFIMATLEIVFSRQKLSDAKKVHLAETFSKILLDIQVYVCMYNAVYVGKASCRPY